MPASSAPKRIFVTAPMSDARKPPNDTHNIKAAPESIFHERDDEAKAEITVPQKQYGRT